MFSSQFLPLVACESYGNYELYYVHTNPKIGIEVLEEGLQQSNHYGAIAEDLGYIYRDEQCIHQAIKLLRLAKR
ncbi:hypothetical protein HX045_15670 [Myroides odoratimimus]|uniref:Uncharacterized protein n=2 Tax=Myroides odoratimimus TaxID=76832 RepID=A0AAV3F2A2_9FLAO|nr:hypothetical protein [Myroides odoratimimus]EHO11656.1 hypothetical protein HMPREF9715_02005 [Myroides odoratimimus CIP 101113]EPH13216.1 hypothetical protein HMPREF9713_00951 [Myroides odoratimimus CCUG 12700]MDM1097750.1 hypothetical protein [Myroides odoratimimus]MDM1328129.1 hypothetical protein [Myroides odoratimimus]MDM1415101.1 hypothetical protein [Myroides odoratimimus]